jgi:hypothetical protein
MKVDLYDSWYVWGYRSIVNGICEPPNIEREYDDYQRWEGWELGVADGRADFKANMYDPSVFDNRTSV